MGSTARAGQDESDGQRRARATRQPWYLLGPARGCSPSLPCPISSARCVQTARFDAREMIVIPVDVRGDRGVGDGAGGGDERENSCENVERTRLMMRCRRGARSRGAIRVPGRSRPGGVRPRQSYIRAHGLALRRLQGCRRRQGDGGARTDDGCGAAIGQNAPADDRVDRGRRRTGRPEVNVTSSGPKGCGRGRRSEGLFSG